MSTDGKGKAPTTPPPTNKKKAAPKKVVAAPKITAKEQKFIDNFGEMLREVDHEKERKAAEKDAATHPVVRWFQRHRGLVAFLIMAAAGVSGFDRIEQAVDRTEVAIAEERKTRVEFDRAEAREEAEEKAESTLACQLRNSFQRNSRQGDGRIVDAFRDAFLAGANTEEERQGVIASAEVARSTVLKDRGPEDEDRDCNKDGQITEADYDETQEAT